MGCTCYYIQEITDVYKSSFYTVPAIPNPTDGPCKCENKGYSDGVFNYQCTAGLTSDHNPGSVTSQAPAAGSSVIISPLTRTGRRTEPTDVGGCDECDCDCDVSGVQVVSDKTEQTGTTEVSVTITVEGGTVSCSCPANNVVITNSSTASYPPGNGPLTWEEPNTCEPYEETVTVQAPVFTRTLIQKWTRSCRCTCDD